MALPMWPGSQNSPSYPATPTNQHEGKNAWGETKMVWGNITVTALQGSAEISQAELFIL